MKYLTPKKTINSAGIQSKTTCTIETSAKNYSLLYKSLYSDPIKAIIRELGVNAVDSPAGSGKSSTINLLKDDVIKRGGIVINFSCGPYEFIEGTRILRQIQPKTPVVVIMEDIDEIMNVHNKSQVLNLLDGINSVSNIAFVATTNYPERLEERLSNRPSRFDKRFKIGLPDATCRKVYFEFLCSKAPDAIDIDKWVEDTDEFSVAHMKELFISVVIFGTPYKVALATLSKMGEDVSREDCISIGFGAVSNK